MPVLESTDRLAPKSMLHHRPIDPSANVVEPPRVPRASRTQTHKPAAVTVPVDVPVWKHSGKSPLPWRQHVLMVGVGVGMVFAVLLVFLGQFLIGWIGTTMDDLHYGMPRTMQTDAYVGHEPGKTPSHFIAENLRGRVLIIELPGGDAQHPWIFVGPQISGVDADRDPVTLSFVDRNGAYHPDMLVQFGSMQIWYVNEHGTFVPQ
jgi:hypothetical protein